MRDMRPCSGGEYLDHAGNSIAPTAAHANNLGGPETSKDKTSILVRLGNDTAGEKRIVKPCLDFARRRIRHDNSPCPIRSGETTSVLCSRRPSRNEWRAVSPARRVANERRAGRSVDVFHLHIRRRGESESLCPGEEDPGQGRQQALPQARHLSRQSAPSLTGQPSDLRFGPGQLGFCFIIKDRARLSPYLRHDERVALLS